MPKNVIHSKKQESIWFLLSSGGIAGSESRIVKIMSSLANKYPNYLVKFVVNEKVLVLYKKNYDLWDMLTSAPIEIINIDNYKRRIFLKTHIIERIIKHIENISEKCKLPEKIVGYFILTLLRNTWIQFLQMNIKNNDIIHCFFGTSSRYSSLYLSTVIKNRIFFEITASRPPAPKKYLNSFHVLFHSINPKNLNIICVTENASNSLTREDRESIISKKNIKLYVYPFPFIEVSTKKSFHAKENIIIFPHRFIKAKNPEIFVLVIKSLFLDCTLSNWKVFFRGNGPDVEYIKSELKPWINKDQVDIGYTDNLSTDFAKTKICVSLITTGNHPSNSLYESLRYGNLQIISDTGRTREYLTDPGLFYSTLNVDDLKLTIKKAVKVCESPYYEKKAQEMEEYYHHLVNQNLALQFLISLYQNSAID